MEEASYVPPPPEKVMELLDNLEKYFHMDDEDCEIDYDGENFYLKSGSNKAFPSENKYFHRRIFPLE